MIGSTLKSELYNYVHLDLKAHAFRNSYLERLVRQIAECGAQGILLEAEDKHPHLGQLGIAHRHPVRGLGQRIAGCGLDVIPLVQTVGHAEYVLGDGRYAPYREALGDAYQYCLCNPDLVPFLKRMIDLHLDGSAGKTFVSLGGDEPWFGGRRACPACSRRIARHGLETIYVNHLNPLIEHCAARGATPMVWADFLLAHPAAMRRLDRRVVLKVWDYGYTRAAQWNEVIARVRRTGFTSWAAPASRSSGDSPFLPEVGRHAANVRSAVQAALAGQTDGFVNTAWAIRHTPTETVMPLLYAGARSIQGRGKDGWHQLIGEYGRRHWGLRDGDFARFYLQLCPVWRCFVDRGYLERDCQGHWHPRDGVETRFEDFYRSVDSAADFRRRAATADRSTAASLKRLRDLKPSTGRGRSERDLWRHLLQMQRLKIRTALVFLAIREGERIAPAVWSRLRATVAGLRLEAGDLLREKVKPTTLNHELQIRFDEERHLLESYA